MSTVLKLSEAASLALHAGMVLARNPGRPVSTGEMASALRVSEAHLAKVMQRLTKSGLTKSVRGPAGGFLLARNVATTTLLDVFEAVEGPLVTGGCLLGWPACDQQQCLMGGLLESLNAQAREKLGSIRLADLTV